MEMKTKKVYKNRLSQLVSLQFSEKTWTDAVKKANLASALKISEYRDKKRIMMKW